MTVAAYRAMGPRNAVLPEATGQVIGFLHNPDRWPFQQYTQLVGLDDESQGVYRYAVIEPDAPNQYVNPGEFAWGWDDPVPSGEIFKPRVTWRSNETLRYAFAYTLGERTQKAWKTADLNPQSMYDRIRMNQSGVMRASQAADNARNASFAAYNTSSLQALMGNPSPAAYFDQSSGAEQDPTTGLPNPNFQIIKKTFNTIIRRIDLQTNGAVSGEEFIAVMGPKVAQKIGESGEMVNFLKQQENAKADLMQRNGKWGVPDQYAGWKLVVEDTPRVLIRTNVDGTTMADPTVATTVTPAGSTVAYKQRDYVWNDDTIIFCSRSGGLDGGYGFQNFSTFQMYYYGGLARVKAETDPWNELLKGAIVLEHQFEAPALLSGFKLTGTLSALPS